MTKSLYLADNVNRRFGEDQAQSLALTRARAQKVGAAHDYSGRRRGWTRRVYGAETTQYKQPDLIFLNDAGETAPAADVMPAPAAKAAGPEACPAPATSRTAGEALHKAGSLRPPHNG